MALIVLAAFGVALIVIGAALAYPPAGFVVLGAALIVVAYLIAEEGK